MSSFQLLNGQTCDESSGTSTDSNTSMFDVSAREGISAQEAVFLKSRLLHAEELGKGVKAELSKTRNDCMRLQGAEVTTPSSFQETSLSNRWAVCLTRSANTSIRQNNFYIRVYEIKSVKVQCHHYG